VVADDKAARQLAEQSKAEQDREAQRPHQALSLDELFVKFQQGQVQELNLVLKTDVAGSLQPIIQQLAKLGDDKLRVKVLQSAAGNITESDVMLAAASNAVVIGFNNGVEAGARRMADIEGVDIRLYTVIYNLTEDIEKALKGLLAPTVVEVVDGHAEVRQIFRIGRTYAVAGCGVTDGKIIRNSIARVYRQGSQELVFEGQVGTLKRFKDDVREVAEGYECGVGLENFSDWEVGDRIEFYRKETAPAA
jgi:translation initiation factor IF-2